MQIVIEIPEEDYKNRTLIKYFGCYSIELDKIIYAGTPLLKGHGRIIDYGYVVDAIDDWINAEEYRYTNATDYLRNRIENVPTIIEADGEVTDE